MVGTSAVIVLSLDPNASDLASVPLGAFILGSSLVSLLTFGKWYVSAPRKVVFLLGIAFAALGTVLGLIAVGVAHSILLLSLATLCFGMATGIGFGWRFAAVEVVPPHWAARAVTLVVSGGCLAAFAGPESAGATRHTFAAGEYFGVFVMTGVFTGANFIFTLLVQFPTFVREKVQDEAVSGNGDSQEHTKPSADIEGSVDSENNQSASSQASVFLSLVTTRHFIIPMLVATAAWAAMGVPMSMARIVMAQVGYSSRQSLTTIELHFLGMYLPGFFTGNMIQAWTPRTVCRLGAVSFSVGAVCLLFADENDNTAASISLWHIGLILVGVGWNWGFTGATVWLTAVYQHHLSTPQEIAKWKRPVQAANDGLMFLLSGVWIFSSSYIFKAGGSGLDGWKVLNFVVVGIIGVYFVILVVDFVLERETASRRKEREVATGTRIHDDVRQS